MADAADSKSATRKGVKVRLLSPAPLILQVLASGSIFLVILVNSSLRPETAPFAARFANRRRASSAVGSEIGSPSHSKATWHGRVA
jgi:hypothetical protein